VPGLGTKLIATSPGEIEAPQVPETSNKTEPPRDTNLASTSATVLLLVPLPNNTHAAEGELVHGGEGGEGLHVSLAIPDQSHLTTTQGSSTALYHTNTPPTSLEPLPAISSGFATGKQNIPVLHVLIAILIPACVMGCSLVYLSCYFCMVAPSRKTKQGREMHGHKRSNGRSRLFHKSERRRHTGAIEEPVSCSMSTPNLTTLSTADDQKHAKRQQPTTATAGVFFPHLKTVSEQSELQLHAAEEASDAAVAIADINSVSSLHSCSSFSMVTVPSSFAMAPVYRLDFTSNNTDQLSWDGEEQVENGSG
jgi:hypothetical protein